MKIHPTEIRSSQFVKKFVRSSKATCGFTILLIVVFFAVFAPVVAPHDPTAMDVKIRLQPPSFLCDDGTGRYIFGTDELGRDIFSRVVFGARVSLFVAICAVLISLFIGGILGMAAGYWSSMMDRVIMRLTDVQLAFPFMLFSICIIAALGPSLRNTIIALGLSGWPLHVRIIRGEILSIREKDFVSAGKALGASDLRIMRYYLLPNVISPMIVIVSFQVAQMIILESALSFLGLGVQPPNASWGGMLSDSRDYLVLAWWPATFPGIAIMLSVMGINLIGDWLRDVLDPRLK